MEKEISTELVNQCQGTDGINVSANTVTKGTEHLVEDEKKLVRWAHHFARENQLSWKQLTERSNIDSSTWYKIWHDKYTNSGNGKRVSLKNICKKIASWKRREDQQGLVRRDVFIETDVWSKIEWICDKARDRNKIGFIYGESHSGKTACLQEYRRRNNHGQTYYVDMPPSSGVQLMMKFIAKSMYVAQGTTFDKLLQNVIAALDETKVLLIDNVHRVFTNYQKTSVLKCMDTLQYIYDHTHCGMVISGTNVFRSELQEGNFRQSLKQMQRRGLYELQLGDMPSRNDLDLFADSRGLPPATGDAEEIMLSMVKENGIAIYLTRLDDAIEVATKRKQEPSWAHFIRAIEITESMKQITK